MQNWIILLYASFIFRNYCHLFLLFLNEFILILSTQNSRPCVTGIFSVFNIMYQYSSLSVAETDP